MTIVTLRPMAETNLVERTQYYQDEGGSELGARFFNAAVASLRAIEKMPGAGSPRIGELCDIPGLRVRRVRAFPVGWFYFEHPATTLTSFVSWPTHSSRRSERLKLREMRGSRPASLGLFVGDMRGDQWDL